jgi:hypothetical protein
MLDFTKKVLRQLHGQFKSIFVNEFQVSKYLYTIMCPNIALRFDITGNWLKLKSGTRFPSFYIQTVFLLETTKTLQKLQREMPKKPLYILRIHRSGMRRWSSCPNPLGWVTDKKFKIPLSKEITYAKLIGILWPTLNFQFFNFQFFSRR